MLWGELPPNVSQWTLRHFAKLILRMIICLHMPVLRLVVLLTNLSSLYTVLSQNICPTSHSLWEEASPQIFFHLKYSCLMLCSPSIYKSLVHLKYVNSLFPGKKTLLSASENCKQNIILTTSPLSYGGLFWRCYAQRWALMHTLCLHPAGFLSYHECWTKCSAQIKLCRLQASRTGTTLNCKCPFVIHINQRIGIHYTRLIRHFVVVYCFC